MIDAQRLEEAIDRLQKFAPLWEAMAIVQEALKELREASGALERAQQKEAAASEAAAAMIARAESQTITLLSEAEQTMQQARQASKQADMEVEAAKARGEEIVQRAETAAAKLVAQGETNGKAAYNSAIANLNAVQREIETATGKRGEIRTEITRATAELIEIQEMRAKLLAFK